MAKGFKINGTDFDDVFEPARSGFSSVTFTGLSPTCTYMARTGDASNPNAAGYYKYNGTAYDAHPLGYKIPKSLSIGGSWISTQCAGKAPTTAGLTYTVTYQDGTTASVTATLTSPSSWSSTPGTQIATFSYTEHGVAVTATRTATVVPVYRVGGVIFYINTSVADTYTFFNASGDRVSAPTVGTDCTNWTYAKTGTGDRFYAYYGFISSKQWGYYNIKTSATGNSIGAGKTNSSKILAITDTSGYYSGSIWEYIKSMRTNKTNGCDDWFVGCNAEYNELKSSGIVSWFSSYNIWSSCEQDRELAASWSYRLKFWLTAEKTSTQFNLIPIRAF